MYARPALGLLIIAACSPGGSLSPAQLAIEVEPLVNLGQTYVTLPVAGSIEVRNTGTGLTRLLACTCDHPDIEVELPAPVELYPAEKVAIDITWTPRDPGILDTTLWLTTDFSQAPVRAVPMTGIAREVPVCDDANACTTDVFSFAAEACRYGPLSSVSCADNACVTDGVCDDGICVGLPVTCDDGADCTRDVCHAELGCESVPDDAACDDLEPCTVEICTAHGCEETVLQDGAVCGELGCEGIPLCASGACTMQLLDWNEIGPPWPEGCDVDECSAGLDACGTGTACVNTFGAYTCECVPAFCEQVTCARVSSCEDGRCVSEIYPQYAPALEDCPVEPICDSGWCWEYPRPHGYVGRDIWGASSNDVWAINQDTRLRWDGAAWRREPTPLAVGDWLEAIWGFAADEVYVAGRYGTVQRWTGSAWELVGERYEGVHFNDLWGSRGDDLWAVGWASQGGPVAMHWDGTEWILYELNDQTYFNSVWGSASNEVWAGTDSGELWRWDGAAWRLVAGFPGRIESIYASSVDDIWVSEHGNTSGPDFPGWVWHWHANTWESYQTGGIRTKLFGFGANAVWRLDLDAVHDASNPFRERGNQLAFWDGAQWHDHVLDAAPPLGGIWGSSPEDVWAVGFYGWMAHWNGSRWKPLTDPRPQSAEPLDFLMAVWGSSATDVWVLRAQDPMGDRPNAGQLLHWDGTGWETVEPDCRPWINEIVPPVFLGEYEYAGGAISGTGTGDVWIGGEQLCHWDGTSWTGHPEVTQGAHGIGTILDIWATTPSDVWVVGDTTNAWHWDGTAWVVHTGLPTRPSSVWVAGPNDVWAVGRWATICRWNGLVWHEVAENTVVEEMGWLTAVRGSGPSNVWVGGTGGIAHWDGTEWVTVYRREEDTYYWNEAREIAVIGQGQAWAVGNLAYTPSDDESYPNPTVVSILRLDATSATVSGHHLGDLTGVWSAPTGEAWAVGRYGTILHYSPAP